MQIFKKKNVTIFVASSFILFLTAETEKNGISYPKMPTISAPIIGESFYIPGTQNFPYTGRTQNFSKEIPKQEKSDSNQNEQKKQIPLLTVDDLKVLEGLGLLGNLTSLSAKKSDDNTKEILDKILNEIESIKSENQEVKMAQNFKNSAKIDGEFPQSGQHPKVLRFNVNGSDILKTCQKIYISDIQNDGTFLVTGDRKFLSDGKIKNETFHILFMVSNIEGGANYEAVVNVMQNDKNENSFLYELSQLGRIGAMRTGNFVTIKNDENDFKVDFLIDLGKRDVK